MTDAKTESIQSAAFRYEGRRLVLDDLGVLERLSERPALPEKEDIDNYIESLEVEYYMPLESRFVVKKLYFYIPLFDPQPRKQDEILTKHIQSKNFFDLIRVIEDYPKYSEEIKASYSTTLNLYESISEQLRLAENKDRKNQGEAYSKAFSLCESLAAYEPSLVSLELLGDFISWNLNYLIRALNSLQFSFSASDRTTAYLIKRRNMKWEAEGLPYDENFTILSALFFEQAFPGRSLEELKSEHLHS